MTALEAGDEKLDEFVAGYEELVPRLRDLAVIADWAAERGTRIRLSFDMGHEEPTAPRPEMHEHGPLLGPFGR